MPTSWWRAYVDESVPPTPQSQQGSAASSGQQAFVSASSQLMNQAIASQQAAMARSIAQSQAIFGQTTIRVDNSGLGQVSYGGLAQTVERPENPHQDAEDFCHNLTYMNNRHISEVIVENGIFMKLRAYMGVNTPLSEPIVIHTGYGPLKLRNKDHVLNLDRFMEDVPKCKI